VAGRASNLVAAFRETVMAAAFQMKYKSLKERHFRTIQEPAGLVNRTAGARSKALRQRMQISAGCAILESTPRLTADAMWTGGRVVNGSRL